MRKNIFNYEGEEKEIDLSNVKELKSNNSSTNLKIKKKSSKPKVKFENVDNPKITSINAQKTYIQNNQQQGDEDVPQKFERRKKKFNTLFAKESKIFDNNKKKKRKKGKLKTMKLKENGSKKEVDEEQKFKNKSIVEENEEILEEFEDKEMQTKLEIILEKKYTPTQTLLSYCKCQLFISYENMTGFEYTGLEGILCVVINRLLSNMYLQIYDIMDFKKQFEIELYTNILLNKGYQVMSKKFHTIEFPTFCLGFNFYSTKKAEEIKNIILNYNKVLNSSLFYQYERVNHDTFKQKKLFSYISDPKKNINYNDKKKKSNKDGNNQLDNNKENDSNYLENIISSINKRVNYSISSSEMMLSFYIDKESNEVTFDTSKGANRFLEQNNIEISEINEEYEKMKEKIKTKAKNSKLVTNRRKKSIQEEMKDKENKEKIMEILNQIEGLQTKDKNLINVEDEKEKLNNKIKKFNVTNRKSINQKLQINSSPHNLFFYGDDSDSLGIGEDLEEEEDDEEGEEEDDEVGHDKINKEDDNNIKNILNNNNKSDNKLNNNSNNNINNNLNYVLNLNTGNNNSDGNSDNNKSINLQISGIVKNMTNSSDISSNSVENNKNINNKNNNNNNNNNNSNIFSSKRSSNLNCETKNNKK